jgi:rfaE bifunctional protein nucleotidyltransferase chain/domain
MKHELEVSEEEIKIINNNIHIKHEIHEKIDYKNIVCSKPWGHEFLIYESKKLGIWFLKLTKGNSTSLHTHFNKDTIIIVIKGSLSIKLIDNTVINLNSMSRIFMPHYNFHELSSFSDETYIIEIEIFNENMNFTDKNDLLRIHDKYKRETTGYSNSVIINKHNLDVFNYFYLDHDFEKNMHGVNFKVTELSENNLKEKVNILNKYTYNILLDGIVYQDMNFIKEGSFLNTLEKIQLPNDKALLLSIEKTNYVEDSKIIYDNEQLKIICNQLKGRNKKIILSSGCFDIIHVGHINTLRESKKLGDILMICLSSDEQISALKGKNRPINNYQDRIDLFKTISYVDYIILYNEQNIEREESLGNIMKIVNPHLWVKGNDYNKNDILKKHPYLKQIKLIENIENKSTTNIIKKINENH